MYQRMWWKLWNLPTQRKQKSRDLNKTTTSSYVGDTDLLWGSWRGGPYPISQPNIIFQISVQFSSNPSLCYSNLNPIPIFLLLFVVMNPSLVHETPFPSPWKRQIPSPILPLQDPPVECIHCNHGWFVGGKRSWKKLYINRTKTFCHSLKSF